MRILARLPNWVGDTVMSLSFVEKLQKSFPSAHIELIVKKTLESIVANIPGISAIHLFDKRQHKGLVGAFKFGKAISLQNKYDLFFCLPDSFSSAAMGYATGAKHRAGYRNEFRSFLFTHAYTKPANLHRAEEYAVLIDLYLYGKFSSESVDSYKLNNTPPSIKSKDYIVANFNTEASSKRIPVEKAIQLTTMLQQKYNHLPIKIIGGPNDKWHIEKIYSGLPSKNNIENMVAKTSLTQLIELLQNAFFVVSTDSGPAHIASALNTPLVVIFGSTNEANTGPYKNKNAIVVRHGMLPCEPCVKSPCKLAPLPVCLTEFDLNKVTDALDRLIHV